MPWYTWVFSGAGAAAVVPLLGLLAKLMRSRLGNAMEARSDGTGNGPAGDEPVAPKQLEHAPGDTRVAGAAGVALKSAGQAAPPSAGLVDSLLAIPGMDDPAFRRAIYDHIPAAVVQQINMDRRARFELISVVDTFGQYPNLEPWHALLNRVRELLPGHLAVARLEADLAQRGLIDLSRH